MTSYALSYAVALTVFLGIDIVWIRNVMQPVFERNLGPFLLDTPRLGAAAAFYALYIAGVIYFAVSPAAAGGSWRIAAVNGAWETSIASCITRSRTSGRSKISSIS